MQEAPLLQQIDQFFTSATWTSLFPFLFSSPPCKNHLRSLTLIKEFRLAPISLRLILFDLKTGPDCMNQIKNVFLSPVSVTNSAHTMSAKFKLLRKILKLQAKNISNLSKLITNYNIIVAFFEKLEEFRTLHSHEFRFRNIIKEHVNSPLRMQNQYWSQKYTQRLTQFGDENIEFFHSVATMRHKKM